MEKSESSFKRLLRDMDDDQIRQYYDDLELTAFPVLIIKEYQRRFDAKHTQQVVEKLKIQTELARQKSSIIKKLAAAKGSEIGSMLVKQASDTVAHASSTVSQGVASAKKMASSSEKNLELLEKLAALQKKGVITTKEYQQKKKEILDKI